MRAPLIAAALLVLGLAQAHAQVVPESAPGRSDAEEIRLYVRELASQLAADPAALAGVTSVPSAFVDQDTRATSSFGRLLGEQLTYELSARGYPVKEIRAGATPPKAQGRKGVPSERLAVLAGSYYVDRQNVFVNARLVEPSGRVVRTASVLIPMTPTLRRMLGMEEPTGLRPVLPTTIAARDVNDPPCQGRGDCFKPYSPASKKATAPVKRSTAKKTTKPKPKPNKPCPPGCEPVDAAKKTEQAKPAKPQAAQ